MEISETPLPPSGAGKISNATCASRSGKTGRAAGELAGTLGWWQRPDDDHHPLKLYLHRRRGTPRHWGPCAASKQKKQKLWDLFRLSASFRVTAAESLPLL